MVPPLTPLMAISFYSKCFRAKRGNWDVHSYSRKWKVYSTEYNCNMHNFLKQIPIARPLHFCTLKIHKFKYPKLRLVHFVLRQAAGPSRFLENLPHVSTGLEVTMAEFINGQKPEFYGIWSSTAFGQAYLVLGVLCHQLAFICIILCFDAAWSRFHEVIWPRSHVSVITSHMTKAW